jgi:hypothetical protein
MLAAWRNILFAKFCFCALKHVGASYKLAFNLCLLNIILVVLYILPDNIWIVYWIILYSLTISRLENSIERKILEWELDIGPDLDTSFIARIVTSLHLISAFLISFLLFFTHFQIIYGLFIGLFCNWAAQQ